MIARLKEGVEARVPGGSGCRRAGIGGRNVEEWKRDGVLECELRVASVGYGMGKESGVGELRRGMGEGDQLGHDEGGYARSSWARTREIRESMVFGVRRRSGGVSHNGDPARKA